MNTISKLQLLMMAVLAIICIIHGVVASDDDEVVCTSPSSGFGSAADQTSYLDCTTMVGDVWFRTLPVLTSLRRVNGSLTHYTLTSMVGDWYLPNLTIVTDNVIIAPSTLRSEITTISMPALETVGGYVSIGNNDALTSIDLSSLVTIGGSFVCRGNQYVTNVSLSSLTTIGNGMTIDGTRVSLLRLPLLTTIGGDLTLTNNGWLTTLDGSSFPLLQSINGALIISGHGANLTSINGAFPALVTTTGNITITVNPFIMSITDSWPLLTNITAMSMTNMTRLQRWSHNYGSVTAIGGSLRFTHIDFPAVIMYESLFPSLLRLTGDLYIASSAAGRNLTGFTSLTDVSGSVTIIGNSMSFISNDTFGRLSSCYNFSITGSQLQSLPLLPSLTICRGAFTLSSLSSYYGVINSSLTTIGGALTISDTAATSIRFDTLLTVGGAISLSNIKIVALDTFHVVESLAVTITGASVLESIVAFDNTTAGGVTLSECPSLRNVSMFHRATTLSTIQFTNLPRLYSLDGFNKVSVSGILSMINMSSWSVIGAATFTSLRSADSVIIDGANITSLSCFDQLVTMASTTARLTLNNLAALSSLGEPNINNGSGGFPSLTSIGISGCTRCRIDITNNPMLQSIGGLNRVTYLGSSVSWTQSITIEQNAALTSITGMNGLRVPCVDPTTATPTSAQIGNCHIWLRNNIMLQSLTGFQNLTIASAELLIMGSPRLTVINFPSLTTVNSNFRLDSAFAGEELTGFPLLNRVRLQFTITNCNMTRINTFNRWNYHDSTITISNNRYLVRNDWVNVTLTGTAILNIGGNSQLQNVGSFNYSSGVGQTVTIGYNPSLITLTGLQTLVKLTGSMILQYNGLYNLTGLDAFAEANTLSINYHTRLRSLAGLQSFRRLTTLGVGNSLTITGNGNLALPEFTLYGLVGPITNTLVGNAGTLSIASNPGLIGWGNAFSGQTSLGAAVKIADNPNLVDLAGFHSGLSMTAVLEIDNNPRLRSLSGLACIYISSLLLNGASGVTGEGLTSLMGASVREVGTMTLASQPSLTTFGANATGFNIIGSFSISNNAQLRNLSNLVDTVSIGTLVIQNNPLLVAISGFTSVTTISTNLYVASHASLTTLNGFNSLNMTSLMPAITIQTNVKLIAMPALLRVTNVAILTITGNTLLPNLDDLINLNTIRTTGSVIQSAALASISGLCGLRRVTGTLLFSTSIACCNSFPYVWNRITGLTSSVPSGGSACRTTCSTSVDPCQCEFLPDQCGSDTKCSAVIPSYTCDYIQCSNDIPNVTDSTLTPLGITGDLYGNTTNYRYPASFTYQCPLGYGLNGSASSCSKTTGAWSAHPNCVDVNECMTGGCDARATCENAIGSFVCGPIIIPGTLTSLIISDDDISTFSNNDEFSLLSSTSGTTTIISGPSESILAASLVSGASYVEMLIIPGNQTISSVSYTQVISPYMTHECLSFNMTSSSSSSSSSYSTLRCQLAGGHGANYTFTISYCGWVTCNSTRGTDRMTFPSPIATPGTLRVITNFTADLDGIGSTSITLPSNDAGQLIAWNGRHFLNSSTDLLILFGPYYSPELFKCTVIESLTTDTRVVCSTSEAYSTDLVITMYQDEYTVQLTDTINYPLNYPVVYRITGCSDQADNTTTDCPTAGNVVITLTGVSFITPITVFVSGQICVLKDLLSSTLLTCTLPAGAGFLQAVSIASLDISSSAALLLSYAAPVITSIIGCSSSSLPITSINLELTLCNRTGGELITIVGTNFGASGASVYIGNTACSSVIHDSLTPHELITCTLPTGNKLNLALVLFQRNGELSTSSISIGYRQCQPGTYENGLQCLQCAAGRFSLVESVSKCDDCIPGRYTNISGAISCSDCPVGYVQPLTNATSCSSCPPGSYIGSTGKTECLLCPTGKYASEWSSMSCESCAIGRYQDLIGNITCNECAIGRYSPAPEQSSCTPCSEGSAVNRTAATTCDPCTQGKYQPTTGQAICLLCHIGEYSESTSATECTPCAAGRFASSNGTNICESCGQGLYQSATGQANCLRCTTSLAGTIAATACGSCSSGFYAGVDACLACPLQTQLREGGCLCNAAYYSTVSNTSTGEFICQTCPNGAKCDVPGVSVATLIAAAGWWSYYSNSSQSLQFQRCLRTAHCDIGGCATSRTGPLCAVCENGFEENGNGQCVKCLSSNGQAGRIAGLAIAAIVGLIILIVITLKMLKVPPPPDDNVSPAATPKPINQVPSSPSSLVASPVPVSVSTNSGAMAGLPSEAISPSSISVAAPISSNITTNTTSVLVKPRSTTNAGKGVVSPSSILNRSHTVSGKAWSTNHTRKLDADKMPNYMSRVKVLVSFYQISSSLGNTAGLGWPSHFSSFINAFSFLQFDLMPSSSTTCDTIGYYRQWLILVIVPVALMLVGSLGFALYYLCMRNGYSSYQRSLTMAKFWKILLFVQFLFFPGVSARVIEMFNCISVDGTRYLRADMSLICGDDEWHRYASVAYVYVALWIIGVPLLLFIVVQYLKGRQQLNEPFTLLSLGFLYEAYTSEAPWFNMLDVAHKLFQTTLVVLIPSQWQLSMAMLAAVVYLMCILIVDPYTHLLDDALHSLAQIEIMLLLLGGMAWAEEGNTGSNATDLLLSILLVILFFIIIIFFIHQIWNHGRLLANKHHRNIALFLPSCMVTCMKKCGLLDSSSAPPMDGSGSVTVTQQSQQQPSSKGIGSLPTSAIAMTTFQSSPSIDQPLNLIGTGNGNDSLDSPQPPPLSPITSTPSALNDRVSLLIPPSSSLSLSTPSSSSNPTPNGHNTTGHDDTNGNGTPTTPNGTILPVEVRFVESTGASSSS